MYRAEARTPETSSPVAVAIDPSTAPQDVADRTVEFFAGAHGDEQIAERLIRAGTTVHVHLGEDAGVTLRLDRMPIEVVAEISGRAEVEVWCSPAGWAEYMRGTRRLAMAIMHQEAEFSGPVRKFLAITPILRSLDASVWG